MWWVPHNPTSLRWGSVEGWNFLLLLLTTEWYLEICRGGQETLGTSGGVLLPKTKLDQSRPNPGIVGQWEPVMYLSRRAPDSQQIKGIKTTKQGGLWWLASCEFCVIYGLWPDASSIGACRPRIFFINGFLCFLEDKWQRNGEGRERGDATSRRRWV